MQMKKGQRDKLEKYIDNTREFAVILYISGSAEYDYICFGLDANDKLSDDRYMIFIIKYPLQRMKSVTQK